MIEIHRTTPSLELLSDYAMVPISFDGDSHFVAYNQNGRWQLTEMSVTPFFKDYDTLEDPMQWASRFDMRNWMMFSAFENGHRIGGAVIATRTPGVDMLEGRDDLAVLWDLRVRLDARERGVGSQLMTEAMQWSRTQGCTELKIETQQMNVAACKFYAKMGYELRHVREGQYPGLPDEVQLLWYREL